MYSPNLQGLYRVLLSWAQLSVAPPGFHTHLPSVLFCFFSCFLVILFFLFFFFLPWASLRAGKCQEGYHLPQSGHTPRLGQHYCPCGVRHYLTSVDTGQLPTAYTQTYTIRVGVCVEWYTDVHRCTLVVMERQKHSQNTHIHTALSLGSNEIPLKTGGPTIPLEGFTPFQGVVPITFGLSLLLFLFLFFLSSGTKCHLFKFGFTSFSKDRNRLAEATKDSVGCAAH